MGWDWALLKYIMEDQVLGTMCHIGQGSSSTRVPRGKHCPAASWPCSAVEQASPTRGFIAATEGSKCQLSLLLLSVVLPKLLHNCRQVVPSEDDTATDSLCEPLT